MLPTFQNIDCSHSEIQCLVITPTRELAIQISKVAGVLQTSNSLQILAAYGGQDINAQLHKLKDNVHVVIGTPGRILDHLRRGTICLNKLKYFIVDEADQMFQIGFKTEIEEIIDYLPSEHQTLCFSATLDRSVDNFAHTNLKDPVKVIAPRKEITLDHITQLVVQTSNRKKYDHFQRLLKENHPQKSIVFCRSRMGTESLYEEMKESGYNVERLHGGLTQAKREFVMMQFRQNQIDYLVATDVASRGLDVDGVSHVFNYNLPDEPESYVHRIGRTGRAGKTGIAYTLFTLKDEKRLMRIEKYISKTIKRISFEPTPLEEHKKNLNHTLSIKSPKNKNSTNESSSNRSSSNKRSSSKNNKRIKGTKGRSLKKAQARRNRSKS